MEDYSMKAKTFFDETMNRCDALLALYDSSADGPVSNEDVLRFAVILAASALDHYVSYSFAENFATHIKNTDVGDKDIEFFAKIGFSLKDALTLLKGGERPFRSISNVLRRYLDSKSMQSFECINDLYRYYGLPKIVENAAQKTKKKKVLSVLQSMLDRRNNIAHACDYNAFHKLQSIGKGVVANWLTQLKQFVYAMDEILDNKFENVH